MCTRRIGICMVLLHLRPANADQDRLPIRADRSRRFRGRAARLTPDADRIRRCL